MFKNAWDASPDRGEIVVYIRRQRPNREDALIEFVIADQGVGIAPADLKRIYEPFFTTKPADQGTGLGLAIVQQILAACGGSLRLASFPGEGTRATVLLPIFTMSEPVNNGKV